jgi:uncharacterized membrane-anchored protein
MCFYIGIEDLAANALIEAFEKGKKRFLTYGKLEEYGTRVIQLLSEKGEKAILILSRESTNALFRNYSEFFEEKENDIGKGIALKDDKEVEDLIEQFRGYLALDVLMAFVNERSVEALEA